MRPDAPITRAWQALVNQLSAWKYPSPSDARPATAETVADAILTMIRAELEEEGLISKERDE